MSEYQMLQVISSLNRRQLLRMGLVGVGLAGAAIEIAVISVLITNNWRWTWKQ